MSKAITKSKNGWGVSEAAAQLHADSLIWDMTFPFLDKGNVNLKWSALERMQLSGFDMISLTLAIDYHGLTDTVQTIAREHAWFRRHADKYIVIESADDILRAKQEGKLAVGFHFQGTNPVAQDLNMVETYYKLGIRHMLMCYNLKNPVGDGCQEVTDGGLSRYGRSLIAEMHRVGMFVDVAHTAPHTAMDVFEAAEGPVIISHANALAVWDPGDGRNVTDEQIKACAASGGVIGVIGFGPNVCEKGKLSTKALLRHIDHISELAGPQHVGLALDYVYDNNYNNPGPYNPNYNTRPIDQIEPEDLPRLTQDMLEAGYSETDIRGVLGENWLRLAREVWK